jgi:hypothetical protein
MWRTLDLLAENEEIADSVAVDPRRGRPHQRARARISPKMLTECSILRPSTRLIGPLPAAGTFRTAASCMKRRSRMKSVIDARNSVAYLFIGLTYGRAGAAYTTCAATVTPG